MPDAVNHPAHYTSGTIECIDATDVAIEDLDGYEAHYIATIMTYLWRWKKKNGLDDLRKAQRYLGRLIHMLNGGKGWGDEFDQ